MKRVCLFAAYDPRTVSGRAVRISPCTISYLSCLRECGFVVHLALSGWDAIDPDDERRLNEIGIETHRRRNAGHDFGAWQHLVAAGCIDDADSILLANDSVFGPLFPLPPIIESMKQQTLDVWGMVESRESRWHLQSWFLCFTKDGFSSPAIQRVMRLPFQNMGRDEIVLHGELGLGAAILADGLNWDARWRAPDRRLRRLVPGNPMHLDFMSVVRSGAVPFLKADLLRSNPARIGWVEKWPTLVRSSGAFTPGIVEDALRDRPGPPHQRQSAIMRALYAAISCDRPEALANLFH